MLDKRLGAVAQACGIAKTVADIGSDHGKLAYHLLQNNQAQHVYVCDISNQSLERAKKLFDGSPYSGFASIVVSDGLQSIPCKHLDVVVMAGMGAKEIKQIIFSKPNDIFVKKYVCQPMKNVLELKCSLTSQGFELTEDVIVQLDRRFYHIISFQEGTSHLSEDELMFGKQNLQTYPTDFVAYLQSEKSKIETMEFPSEALKQKREKIDELLRRRYG